MWPLPQTPNPSLSGLRNNVSSPVPAATRPELVLHPSPARGFSPFSVKTVLLPHVRCERSTEVREGAKPRPLPPSHFPTQNPCPHKTACPRWMRPEGLWAELRLQQGGVGAGPPLEQPRPEGRVPGTAPAHSCPPPASLPDCRLRGVPHGPQEAAAQDPSS